MSTPRYTFTLFGLMLGLAFPARADIGVALVAPLTGSSAVFGEQLSRGTTQAIEDINAHGGVLGQKLVLQQYDDACDPKQAVAVANQIASANIKFVVGHFCSSAGLAAENVFMENEILVVSPAVGHPKFTEDADTFIFRVGLRNDLQGQAMASYVQKNFANKNVAILNDKGAYGVMIASTVKQKLNAAGIQEVLYDSFSTGEKDFSTLITSLKQKHINVLVIGGYHTEIGLITRQMHEQNLNATVIGGTPLMTNEFWAITGKMGEGTVMTFGPDPRTRAEAKAAVTSLRKSGFEPEGYTMYAYAAAQVIAEGITLAQDTHTRKVAATLRKGTYPTVIGDLRFNDKGDIQNPEMVMYQWHDGAYAQIK